MAKTIDDMSQEDKERRSLFIARATAVQFGNDDEIRKEAYDLFNKKWLERQKGE